MFLAIAKFCDVLPGWVWALIVVGLLATTATSTVRLQWEQGDHAKTKEAFATYKLDVTEKARVAELERRTIELHNFRNSERVSDEQTKRLAASDADRADLRLVNDGLRKQAGTFSAGITRDAASGNLARVTARANLAIELFQTSQVEYGNLAEEAERIRVQAVGLLDYIKGNNQCSRPFGDTVPEPS